MHRNSYSSESVFLYTGVFSFHELKKATIANYGSEKG